MGHGHHDHDAEPLALGRVARTSLLTFLAVVALATIIGLVALWPDHRKAEEVRSRADQFVLAESASVDGARLESLGAPCPGQDGAAPSASTQCRLARAKVLSGPLAGQSVELELLGPLARSGLRPGDTVQVLYTPASGEAPAAVSIMGVNRLAPLGWLAAAFVLIVLLVARLRGLLALVGLAFSAAVFLQFMVPALILGTPATLVALVGSTAIMFVVLYATHGVSLRTSAAFVGTLVSLVLTTLLGAVAVEASRLSGLADESACALVGIVGELSFADLVSVHATFSMVGFVALGLLATYVAFVPGEQPFIASFWGRLAVALAAFGASGLMAWVRSAANRSRG